MAQRINPNTLKLGISKNPYFNIHLNKNNKYKTYHEDYIIKYLITNFFYSFNFFSSNIILNRSSSSPSHLSSSFLLFSSFQQSSPSIPLFFYSSFFKYSFSFYPSSFISPFSSSNFLFYSSLFSSFIPSQSHFHSLFNYSFNPHSTAESKCNSTSAAKFGDPNLAAIKSSREFIHKNILAVSGQMNMADLTVNTRNVFSSLSNYFLKNNSLFLPFKYYSLNSYNLFKFTPSSFILFLSHFLSRLLSFYFSFSSFKFNIKFVHKVDNNINILGQYLAKEIILSPFKYKFLLKSFRF